MSFMRKVLDALKMGITKEIGDTADSIAETDDIEKNNGENEDEADNLLSIDSVEIIVDESIENDIPESIIKTEPQIITIEKTVENISDKSINRTIEENPQSDKEILIDKSEPEPIKEEKEISGKNLSDTEITIEKPEQEIKEENPDPPEPKPFKYTFPPTGLLDKISDSKDYVEEIEKQTEKLRQTFEAFEVRADIVDILHGARFTRFETQIGKGVRIRDVLKIEDDIKLNLEAANIHIEAPIPGKTTIGIDVENSELSIVTFMEMIESKEFVENPSDLAVAIGVDVVGNAIVENIENMCHLLIGGTTGSGKSVCISSIIMSILYKADPNNVKLLMVDTKAVNLTMYNGIPHLLIPVVTDLRKSTAALQWAVAEMTDRYRKFADFGARDLTGYNKAVEKYSTNDEPPQIMPRIVIIIDDFSDLMNVDNSGTEESICRLSQMGRAAGIHLVISTQRPSIDVITGIIKANIPSRIAFNVFSAVDSRTILDAKGAEDLLSNGDMLFYPQGARALLRVQGTYVSDKEIENVIDFVKNQMVGYAYNDEVEKKIKKRQYPYLYEKSDNSRIDELFEEAGRFVIEHDKVSIGMLQRFLKIGFNRAARIMDQLAEYGVVGEEEGTKPRRILMTIEQFEQYIKEYM